LPGVIGVIQATEVVKVLLGIGETLSGRLLLYDALNMKFRELRLRKNPECVLCSDQATQTELIDYEQFCGVPGHPVEEEAPVDEGFARLGVTTISQRMNEGWKPFILDVRKLHELEIVKLNYDATIPHEDVGTRLAEIPRDRDILVHCKMGGRSAKASRVLVAAGYPNVTNMEGGITAWAKLIDTDLPTY
jgi:adenylyltransferase/sulfurtransferase